MTDQKQAPEYPEKVWIYPCDISSMKWTGLIETDDPSRPWEQQDYIRADLLEATEKRELEMVRTAQSLTEAAHKFAERIKEAESERDEALAASAAREIAMRDRLYGVYNSFQDECYTGIPNGCACEVVGYFRPYYDAKMKSLMDTIRALPISPDGQQALNEMLADAWDEGWEYGLAGESTSNPYQKDTNEGEA